VFWQDLNSSARQTVSTSSSFQCFITDLTCFRLQVVEKLNVQPSEADDIEPEPEHQVNRVVGRRKGSGGIWLYGIEWKGPDGAWPEISYERFDELDDVCQQMASNAFGPNAATERWKAMARGKQKKKRKGPKLSQTSAREAAQKQRGHKQHQSGTGKGKSRAKQIFEDEALELAPDDDWPKPETAASFVASVDEQWQAERKLHAEDIAAFPQPASAERVRRSLLKFREMVSQRCVIQVLWHLYDRKLPGRTFGSRRWQRILESWMKM
jgi:hypothetical protein